MPRNIRTITGLFCSAFRPSAAHFQSPKDRSLLMMEMKSVANIRPELFEHVPAYARCQCGGTALPGFGGTILARGFPCIGYKGGAVNADKSRDSRHLASARGARNEGADHGVFGATPNASLVGGFKPRVLAVHGGDAKSDSAGNDA